MFVAVSVFVTLSDQPKLILAPDLARAGKFFLMAETNTQFDLHVMDPVAGYVFF